MHNQTDVVREEVRLEEITQSVLDSLAVAITNTQTKVVTDFSEAEVITAIRSYITSIVYNLISNAIKYRDPERAPIIRVSSIRAGIHLLVRTR